MISIVVPMYNEATLVRELHRRIVAAMENSGGAYEIIFVNDGSTDGTEQEAADLRPLRLVSLQRNYGETPALDVGIQEAVGEVIVLFDADLQHDPADIPRLLRELSDDTDVVIGWRRVRHDPRQRVVFSRFANFISRVFLGMSVHDFGSGLKVYRSKFIKEFRLWGNAQVFLPAIAKEKGAHIKEVPIIHGARKAGSSKIKFLDMLKAGFDLLSVAFFVRYFYRPLQFFGGWGLVSLFLAFAAFVTAVALRLLDIEDLTATPLPTVGTLFSILGVLLFMMGFLAEILLRVYYALVRHSPYMVRQVRENT